MVTTQVKPARNQSLECLKMAAAVFIVFLHVPFPGKLGKVVSCIARFAVPMFFAISGYFSYQVSNASIRRRVGHLVKLHLIAAVYSIVVACLMAEYNGWNAQGYLRYESLPDGNDLSQWLLLQINPYGGHLWYLSALLLCYGLLWGYQTFRGEEKGDCRPLYQAGLGLFAIFFTLSTLLPIEGMEVPYRAYRNGWLFGFPMFLMGMFLREYRERLVNNFRLTDGKLLLLTVSGFGLSLMQTLGGYPAELPAGMLLAVPAALLLCLSHPKVPGGRLIQKVVSRFGVLSTAVYILHLGMWDLYDLYVEQWALTTLTTKEDTLKPVIILVMALLASLVWERIDALWGKMRKKR